MTQTLHRDIGRIFRAPVASPPRTRQSITWETLCDAARTILEADAQLRPMTTTQTQVVGRLDTVLMGLKHDRSIKDFTLGEFKGHKIEVFVTVRDDLYFRRHLMPIRSQIEAALEGLDAEAVIDITTDLTCDDAHTAR